MEGLAKRGNTALSSQGSSWEKKRKQLGVPEQLGEKQSGKSTDIRFSAMERPHLPSTAGKWDAFQVKIVKMMMAAPDPPSARF